MTGLIFGAVALVAAGSAWIGGMGKTQPTERYAGQQGQYDIYCTTNSPQECRYEIRRN